MKHLYAGAHLFIYDPKELKKLLGIKGEGSVTGVELNPENKEITIHVTHINEVEDDGQARIYSNPPTKC